MLVRLCFAEAERVLGKKRRIGDFRVKATVLHPSLAKMRLALYLPMQNIRHSYLSVPMV
jgi:hypothetical protein